MKKLVILMVSVVVLAACGDQKSDGQYQDENFDKVEAAAEIEKLESELISPKNKAINFSAAQNVVKAYRKYALQLPLDPATPDYLFKAADVEMGLQNYRKAEDLFKRVYDNYPNYEKRVMSLYLMAFVNDNHLNQKGKAKEIYEQLIERHSEDKLAQDAIAALDILTLSDDELIDFLKQKNQDTLTQ